MGIVRYVGSCLLSGVSRKWGCVVMCEGKVYEAPGCVGGEWGCICVPLRTWLKGIQNRK